MDNGSNMHYEYRRFHITIFVLVLLSIILNLFAFLVNRISYWYLMGVNGYLTLAAIILFLVFQILFAIYLYKGNKTGNSKRLSIYFLLAAISYLLRLLDYIDLGYLFSGDSLYRTLYIMPFLLQLIGYTMLAIFCKNKDRSEEINRYKVIAAAIILGTPILQNIIFRILFAYSVTGLAFILSLVFPAALLLYMLKMPVSFDKLTTSPDINNNISNKADYSALEAQLLNLKDVFQRQEITEDEYKRRKKEILDKLI